MPSTNSKSTKPLRDNIRDLGQRLGRVLAECDSPELLEEVELVRRWAKDFRRGKRGAKGSLDNFLTRAEYEKSFKIARSFTEFLRLANAAEQYHRIRRRHYYETHSKSPQKGSVESFLKNLKPSLHKEVFKKLNSMEIDLVITAHPTESMRQSAIRRYKHVTQNLAVLDRKDATRWEIEMAKTSINRNIRALWLTEIIQEKGPTPFTEALTGFSIVEEVLWDTVPRYYRRLDALSRKYLGGELGCDAVPIRFSSWVGGDRDGNPNVTATVTKSILYQGMRKAYRLILSEVEWLQKEMSFNMASDELLDLLPEGDRTEPYRIFLSQLRRSIESSERLIEEGQANYDKCVGHLIGKSEIIDQLKVIYRSLVAIGAEDLAQGRTLDLIRRLEVFGVALLGLDIRQCSDVHEEVIGELASAEEEPLSYAKLSEREKQTYLIERLEGKKPIIESMKWSSLGKEVLETCRLINDFPEECFRTYIVSMTEEPSDILEVLLLFKIAGVKRKLPLAPLLETPEALENGERILGALLSLPYYRAYVGDCQQVMLGYSDSAKRSGRLASGWLLHQVQRQLNDLAQTKKVRFEFFHGRGGSIGRGGGPVHLALLALPRGNGDGRLRVTEQGESVHGKFGLPGIAERSMELYVSGILEAAVSKAPAEKKNWFSIMDQLSQDSNRTFREFIYERPEFLSYFAQVTPIQELSLYKIGSRPSRRKQTFDFESLRAIPWVYSWTQNRGLLPSWLGLGEALEASIERGELSHLKRMYREWPFFKATMSLFEMVLAKVDIPVFNQYSDFLVEEDQKKMSLEIIKSYKLAVKNLNRLTGHKVLLEDNPVLRRSINVRTPYVDVLNILQCHFLKVYRENPENPWVKKIIALTIGGISAGMRNTG